MTNFEKLKNKINLEYNIFKANMLQSPSVEIFDTAERINDYTHISRVLLSDGLWDEGVCGTLCSCSQLLDTLYNGLAVHKVLTDQNISDGIFNLAVELRRDRQEYDKDLWQRIAADFMRLAAADGYSVIPSDDKHLYAEISLPGGSTTLFTRGNDLLFENDVSDQRLVNLLYDVKSYVLNIQHWAADMPAESPAKGCKQLCDFGSVLLAAKYEPGNGYRFTTWKYGLDKNTLYERRDFDDYRQAYRDFVLRSVLLDEKELFTKDEINQLHSACLFYAMEGEGIDSTDYKRLTDLIEKLDYFLPPYDNSRSRENTDETELEL
jgi:hypothetical protein